VSSRNNHAPGDLTPNALRRLLKDAFPVPRRYWLGYSGGVDSTVLLHLLARIGPKLPAALSVVHIDHGLHGQSADWASHCQRECQRLGIHFEARSVDARACAGESPEAAARRARYAALQELLGPGEMLLTAHHRDDQAETLLLQLLRGAGIEGLSAMPPIKDWCGGWLARPLLGFGRAQIHAWAGHEGLSWVDDPSNAAPDADRNYLRNEVMPMLLARWPAAAKSIARSASHCAHASHALEARFRDLLASALSPDRWSFSLGVLDGLSDGEAAVLLRMWLRDRSVGMPSTRRLGEIHRQVRSARDDAQIRIELGQHALRRFRNRLWLTPARLPAALLSAVTWHGEWLDLGDGRGRVRRRMRRGGIDPAIWADAVVSVTSRTPGACFRPAGREGHRSFKQLAQECAIPPWLRPLVPIVHIDGQPAAMANCCVFTPYAVDADTEGWVVEWEGPGSATSGLNILQEENSHRIK
jgi:tRNA(Ile)-lysidine synthase